MEETTINLNKPTSFLKKITLIIGVSLSFLLPIFIIPVNTFSFLAGKNTILFLGVILLFLAWIIERIKNKDFLISKNFLVISAYLVPISYLLSALFSGSIKAGLIGFGFETSTFAVILSLFLLMFLVAKSFKTKRNVLYLYIGLALSGILMAVVHILRLFLGPEFLSLGILNSATANLIGSWSEVGIFFGLIAIIALITNEYLGRDKMTKILSYVLLSISLLFVWLINFNLVWVFLMIASFFLVIYDLFLNRRMEEKVDYGKLYKKTSPYIFVVALLFVLMPVKMGGILPEMFQVFNYEVRPTMSSTLGIAKSTLATNPIVGAGPTKFVNQWVKYKPLEINMTQFWNSDFNSGSGFVLSSLVTVGLLGFISWLLFLISVIYLGFRLIKNSRNNQLDHFVVLSLFVTTTYLLLFLIFYVPGIVILGLTFLILGALLSFLQQERFVKTSSLSFAGTKVKSIAYIVVMVAILGTSLFGAFMFSKKVMASTEFNKGLVAINVDQDFATGYEFVVSATTKYPTDFYFRNLTDLNLMQLQNVLGQEGVEESVLQEQFQAVFSALVGSAQRAAQLDMSNYLNWSNLAKVYGSVVPLKLEGAYDSALQAYGEAIRLNPSNPLLVLNLANLEIVNEDLEKAKEYIGIAIQMKNNYSDAYYLLSQLEFNAGNKETGFQIIEALASATPNDPQVFLQLGALNFEEADYEKAQAFLERAVTLNPYYSDAKYLLGLTYNAKGEKEGAVGQFKDLTVLNPDDKNIVAILANIEAGRDPFYGFEQQQQASQEQAPAPITEDLTSEGGLGEGLTEDAVLEEGEDIVPEEVQE